MDNSQIFLSGKTENNNITCFNNRMVGMFYISFSFHLRHRIESLLGLEAETELFNKANRNSNSTKDVENNMKDIGAVLRAVMRTAGVRERHQQHRQRQCLFGSACFK